MPADPSTVRTALCRALSGVDQVTPEHASRIMESATARFGPELIGRMYTVFDVDGIDGLVKEPELAGTARAITYSLYTGLLPDPEGKEVMRGSRSKPKINSEADYFESVIWRAIHAHPPALTGGYFGHWKYPPEDLDVEDT